MARTGSRRIAISRPLSIFRSATFSIMMESSDALGSCCGGSGIGSVPDTATPQVLKVFAAAAATLAS